MYNILSLILNKYNSYILFGNPDKIKHIPKIAINNKFGVI